MTCTELHEQITAFVDNRIDKAAHRERIEQHIEHCPECRREYESELLTKMVVRTRGGTARAPESLRAAIAEAIVRDESTTSPRPGPAPTTNEASLTWLERFRRDWVSPGRFLGATALVVVALWYLGLLGPQNDVVLPGTEATVAVGTATGTAPAPRNFLNQASRNLDAILRGSLTVTYESDRTDDLLEFFHDEGVPYASAFRTVRLPLLGGVVSTHGPNDDIKLAHWVYAKGDDVIYFFEIPESTLRRGSVFYLTTDALDRLHRGEELWEEFDARSTICAFEQGDRIVAIASNMDKADLRKAVPGL